MHEFSQIFLHFTDIGVFYLQKSAGPISPVPQGRGVTRLNFYIMSEHLELNSTLFFAQDPEAVIFGAILQVRILC